MRPRMMAAHCPMATWVPAARLASVSRGAPWRRIAAQPADLTSDCDRPLLTRYVASHTYVHANLLGASEAVWHDVRGMLADYGAQEVDAHGGGLTVRVARVGDALRLAMRIIDNARGRHRFTTVRVGLHTGSAVVNIAERVAAIATEGEVLLTDATRSAAAEQPGSASVAEFVPRDPVHLKNVRQPVELWAAVMPQ
jgi:hypothetical protein